MFKSLKAKLVLALGLLTMAIAGCGDTNNNSVTNPNPNPFTPKGTVTGVLVDSVTRAPISGADVYIMDRHATTGEQGQFTITHGFRIRLPSATAALWRTPDGPGAARDRPH